MRLSRGLGSDEGWTVSNEVKTGEPTGRSLGELEPWEGVIGSPSDWASTGRDRERTEKRGGGAAGVLYIGWGRRLFKGCHGSC